MQKALNLCHYGDRIWCITTSKKNKKLWKGRGYTFEGSWKCFSLYFGVGLTCIVRAWSKEEKFLLEVIYFERTNWYIWKNNNWWRFKNKCEAEAY